MVSKVSSPVSDDNKSQKSRRSRPRWPWSPSSKGGSKSSKRSVVTSETAPVIPTNNNNTAASSAIETVVAATSTAVSAAAIQQDAKKESKTEKTITFKTAASGGNTTVVVQSKQAAKALPRSNKIRTSWISKTQYFQNMCDWAFEVVDTDGSGHVDEKELYSGLLLIHLKLGTYAGPAACRPIGRERSLAVFKKMDVDQSGFLDKDEFRETMMVLFSNVLLRVLVQWSMTLIIVPLLAQWLLDQMYAVTAAAAVFISELDEHNNVANMIELTIEETISWTLDHLPGPMLVLLDCIGDLFAAIPESIWNSIPLTLLSTVLGILVVPWMIFKIDDAFQYLADRRVGKTKAA